MNDSTERKDSPLNALIVVVAVSLACSILVSSASILLKPIKAQNQKVERSRHIVALTGLGPEGQELSNDEILQAVEQLDIRIVNIDTGEFDSSIDPEQIDPRAAVNDPETSMVIPPGDDLARLGRRARHAIVYLVWDNEELKRVILPIHGQGMWSTLYGMLALEADLNTIASVTFYEQGETAGLGDQITNPDWLFGWRGRQVLNDNGAVMFRVASGPVAEDSAAALHQVDAISGATVTTTSVTRLVEFWFGPKGYLPFLETLKGSENISSTEQTSG